MESHCNREATKTLEALRNNIAEQWNGDVKDMLFYELPYCHVDEFDYPAIAKMLEEDGAEIVWVALGASRQGGAERISYRPVLPQRNQFP